MIMRACSLTVTRMARDGPAMAIDWDQVRSWVGTVGGLAGFTTLGFNRLDRWRDRRALELQRLTVTTANVRDGVVAIKISYRADDAAERLQVEVRALRPKTLMIVPQPRDEYLTQYQSVSQHPVEVNKARPAEVSELRFNHYAPPPFIGETTLFLANIIGGSTSANAASGSVMIRVTTISSRRQLTAQKRHISPTA